MAREFATIPELEAHVSANPNNVHGILDKAKTLIEREVWLSARQSLGLTAQANYTDKDCSSLVSASAKSILVNIVETASPGGRWFMLKARPNGSAADPLVEYNWEIHDSVNGNCHENSWGSLAKIPLNSTDKIFEYKLTIDGNWLFYIVGYVETISL